MKRKNKIIQFFLISIGLILILTTYFIYPQIKQNKIVKEKIVTEEEKIPEKSINTFENVEYKGFYDIDKPFTVKSENAHIKDDDPDIVYMTNMKVIIYMNDSRTVTITSLKGSYNKVTYDCYFQDSVRAEDGETVVLADNLDLLASNDTATVYNNVYLTNNDGSLTADKVDYDFEKKYYKISMFSDKQVKIKLN
tara:strand:+ start:832 stop:1413 length:582 start_codon:yes stop_codon:yes gene_type:complete